ncbi:hypothetical protein HNY73_013424 [Argiope bruennichi]|uniref:DUF5641 domain-containing protein n=1 Tax=Argiope bruennichi TaxID=94029 RepID=A0A8T0F3Y9_ARGBR|nr:hypothetical protein HNY73_013424 [Argiope bruennichi]
MEEGRGGCIVETVREGFCFREQAIAITADIKKAFLQIQIAEEDHNYTSFFWTEGSGTRKKRKNFKMTRVRCQIKPFPCSYNPAPSKEGDLQKFKVFVKTELKRNPKSNRSTEWNRTPGADNHSDLISRGFNVKSTKTKSETLKKLNTLVVEIEAILNSRPLSPLSVDPTDLQPLTQGHFLVGSSLLSFTEQDTAVQFIFQVEARSRTLKSKFWDRWSREYLQQLHQRQKWKNPQPNLKEGDLVILKDDHKPLQWKLARIKRTISGPDGLV